MAATPDRFSGEADQEGVIFEDQGPLGLGGGDPTNVGGIRRVGNHLRMRDGVGVYDIRDVSHAVVENSVDQVIYDVALPKRLSEIIVWTDAGMTLRLRDIAFTYVTGRCDTIVTRQYEEDGVTVLFTITETIAYVTPGCGSKVASITRVRT